MLLPNRHPRIAYFVSSHGFGHAARTRTILQELHLQAEVTVFSTAPLWFWGDLNVQHVFCKADIGCIQQGTLTIDELATSSTFSHFLTEMPNRFEYIKTMHSETPFDLIATDIAPEPLDFANQLGVQSALVANFTWLEIYAAMPSMHAALPNLQRQYLLADSTYIPGFQTGMTWTSNTILVDAVAEEGSCIREDLNPDAKFSRLVYIDAGRWGTDIGWQSAADYEDTLFIRVGPKLDCIPMNVLQLDYGAVRHADLVKSVDLVVSKPGYGIVTECLANGTLWGCIPRDGFAEDVILIQAAEDRNQVFMVRPEQLESLAFPSFPLQHKASTVTFDGAKQIAALMIASLAEWR